MPGSVEASRLSAERVSEIRRWAVRAGAAASDPELRRAAGAILRLTEELEALRGTDGDAARLRGVGRRRVELERARDLAERIRANGAGDELRAAARAILLLCDDVELAREDASDAGGGGDGGGPPRGADSRGKWAWPSPLAVLSVVVPGAVLVLILLVARLSAPDLDPQGPGEAAPVGAAELGELAFSIAGDKSTEEAARWKLDGQEVSGAASIEDGRLVFRPGGVADGEHAVSVELGGMAPWSVGSHTWRFAIDTVTPVIRIPKQIEAQAGTPVEVRGEAERGAFVSVNGEPVEVSGSAFAVALESRPAEVTVVATDAAGNVTEARIPVVLAPRLPAAAVRAVHVTAEAWANEELRSEVLRLVDQGRINAVELDLKEETGIVGFDADVPLGKEIGAVRSIYDLEEAVRLLHDRGVRVIGRLVAFRDPIHAEAAWSAGKRGQVIQTPDGEPYAGYGGFTNFAHPEVRDYNIDVAEAAAKAGVDEILFDYIRRPDGPLDSMVFPGLDGDPEAAIVSFLEETRDRLAPYGTFIGASVFGIAATRPEEIAQPVDAMARHLDYVAPMLYPSHWGTGEYGLSNPNAQPYEIVNLSLADFEKEVEGTGARVVPWLQDFSLGVDYGPDQVRAQIQATYDAGIDEWILWDPAVTYTAKAIDRDAALPSVGTADPAERQQAELVEVGGVSARTESGPIHTGLAPNELGVVPVLMYHQLLPEGGSDYDLTPTQFRRELERLYEEGYRPVTAADYVSGRIDIPAGTSPVVLTFDDSTPSQLRFTGDGEVDPESAVGIMLDFAEEHPDFEATATFYVNRDPFGGERSAEALRWLHDHGFEIGNHTADHVDLSELSRNEVREQIVSLSRMVRAAVPDAKLTTMALPFGVLPKPAKLARTGSWDEEDYEFAGVMLVGASPAASPFDVSFDWQVPRIRSWPASDLENGSAYWLDRLAAAPELRYVSDGDPETVTVPVGRAGEVADGFRDRVQERA